MHFVCTKCKAVYATETMEIPVLGIPFRCPNCNHIMFLPRVPVVDARLCETCGHIQRKQAQVEGLNSPTKCPKCGASYPESNASNKSFQK